MNYYEYHIGDYIKNTAHLSMLEDGAYRRLIDAYYTREAPLPLERAACYRLARAQTQAERAAVDTVLDEYFEQQVDGWHQSRCDEEITRFQEKSEKARRSANSRWDRSQSDGSADADADGMRTHSEGNATHARPSNQTPVTSNQSPKQPGRGFALPDWVPVEPWKGYVEMRVKVRKPMTDRAKALAIKDLETLSGRDPDKARAILDQSTQKSWQGLFELKTNGVTGKPDYSQTIAGLKGG